MNRSDKPAVDDMVQRRITRWLETSDEPDPPNDALLLIDARMEIDRLRKEVDIKGSRLDDALDEIERLQAENRRLHLQLMIAHSEAAEMYDDRNEANNDPF